MDSAQTGRSHTDTTSGAQRKIHLDEQIDEASDESFPASDAPQWWSGGVPEVISK